MTVTGAPHSYASLVGGMKNEPRPIIGRERYLKKEGKWKKGRPSKRNVTNRFGKRGKRAGSSWEKKEREQESKLSEIASTNLNINPRPLKKPRVREIGRWRWRVSGVELAGKKIRKMHEGSENEQSVWEGYLVNDKNCSAWGTESSFNISSDETN